MFRRVGIFTICLALAASIGCAGATKTVQHDRVIEAPVVIYVPIDPRLTALVPLVPAKGPSCGAAVATAQARDQAQREANAKLSQIATVQGTEAHDWTCRPKAEDSANPADRPGHE